MRIILVILCLASAVILKGELTYNFTYTLQGHTSGKLLLFIPYRVFYESSAAVNFTARKRADAGFEFYFKGIETTGHMMRTSGFSGKTLVVLTANYDVDNAALLGERKKADFDKIAPYYAKFIQRKKQFLFKILPTDHDSIRFTRTPEGIQQNFSMNLMVRFKYYPEKLNICFNIYKILVEMLKIYNHSFLPDKNTDPSLLTPFEVWHGPPLDFSPHINKIGRLAARIIKQYVSFKQEKKFRLKYKVSYITDQYIEICGEAHPDIKIWHDFKIKDFIRLIRVRLIDRVTVEDSIHVELRNTRGRGLYAKSTLKLIEQH